MKKLIILVFLMFNITAWAAEQFIRPSLDRRYDQTCWLATHNAYASERDLKGNAAYVYANQFYNLKEQLERGVRVFEIDTYKRCWEKTLGLFGTQGCAVSVCHGGCEKANRAIYKPWSQVGGTEAMDFMKDVLAVFKEFLDKNREEVVTLTLEDYVLPQFGADPNEIDRQFEAAGINHYILKPEDWNPEEKQGWPVLAWMVATNKRLIVFNEKSAAEHGFKTSLRFASIKYTYDQDATMVRNQWGGAKDIEKALLERGSSKRYDGNPRYLFEIDWYPDGGKILGGAPSTLVNRIAFLFGAEKESPFGGDFEKLNGSDLQNYIATVLKDGLKSGIAKNRYPNIIKVDYFHEGNPTPLSIVNGINRMANDKAKREEMFKGPITVNK